MTVLKYDTDKYSLDIVQNIYLHLKAQLDGIDEVIAIPKNWEVLLDCSTYELYNYIEEIKKIIKKKEIINES